MAATAEIKAVITAEDRASATVSNFGKNVNNTSLGIGIAVAAMGTAALAFGKQSVDAFAESERASAQLDKVLRSTGGAAGVTKEAALDLADSLMHLTGIDDDAILSAENMLLTFTKLSKDEFPAATKTILDTATAMNGGLKPSAEELRNTSIQLGKALQDPDAGLGALKRVGVNVDELSQKFTDSMPIQEKQRLILQELGTEFGGSADKTNTFSDRLLTLQTNFGNLQEKIGGFIATGLNPLLDKLNSWIEKNPDLSAKIGGTAVIVGVLTVAVWGLNTAIGALSATINSGIGRLGIIAAAVAFFYLQIRTARDFLADMENRLAGWSGRIQEASARAGQASGAIAGLYSWFRNIDNAIYNAALSLDNFIRKIPVIGGLLNVLPGGLSSLQARAGGGPVTSNQPYIVGEQGPELFVPTTSGTIIPNGSMPTSQTNNTTTVNISVGLMTGSAIEQREAAQKMFEHLQDIARTQGTTVANMIGA